MYSWIPPSSILPRLLPLAVLYTLELYGKVYNARGGTATRSG